MYYYKKVIEYAGDDTVFNKEVSEPVQHWLPYMQTIYCSILQSIIFTGHKTREIKTI